MAWWTGSSTFFVPIQINSAGACANTTECIASANGLGGENDVSASSSADPERTLQDDSAAVSTFTDTFYGHLVREAASPVSHGFDAQHGASSSESKAPLPVTETMGDTYL